MSDLSRFKCYTAWVILTPDLIKARLNQLGIKADKHLGQHFLINQEILDKIQEISNEFLASQDVILEVGPGLGVLTSQLIANPNQVTAVEKDPVFADELTAFLGTPKNLQVIRGDILDFLNQTSFTGAWCVIANIPYAITSPLIRKLLYRDNPPHHCVLLVQKELAERICAKPGDRNRGLLTVQVEIMAEAQIVAAVSKSSFWPQPEVESALLLLKTRKEALVNPENQKQLMRIVIAGFSSKRKQLLNSLAGGLGKSAEEVRQVLESVSIDPTRRAETLTLEEWQRLAIAL